MGIWSNICSQHLKRERTIDEKSEGNIAMVQEGPASFGKKEDYFTREETYSTEMWFCFGPVSSVSQVTFCSIVY